MNLRRVTGSGRYIPEVDGVRFIAIGLVLFFHAMMILALGHGYFIRPVPFGAGEGAPRWWSFGRYGVQLFFVLSGFILALPFITDRPSLRRYYKRRVTRLEPPYLIALLLWFVVSGAAWKHLGASLVYSHHFIGWNPINEPLWSLEVEIQFYLLLPLLALVFRAPRRQRRAVLGAGVALGLAWNLGLAPAGTLGHFAAYFLGGMLLADLYADRPVTFKPLQNKYVTTIGGMAYSIYLLHWPVMVLLGRLAWRSTVVESVLLVAASLGAGFVFFIFVERPCMEPDWPHRLWSKMVGTRHQRSSDVQNGAPATARA